MKVVVTGGCGFIGANCALRLRASGYDVTVFDSLARPGSERNLAVLQPDTGGGPPIRFVRGDVADPVAVDAEVRHADIVIHLAAQVSVVGGVRNPQLDFQSNMVGTFNVLESARRSERNPIVLVASTNKVYGGLERFQYEERETRWVLPARPHGIAETEPLQPVTPYACSKSAADLYALDYARTFGVRAVVFRQSCVYGIHQRATEEQAWIAWLMKAALAGRPITIHGDGKQVRDLLHIDDLIDAYLKAIAAIDRVAGMVFNVGGGPAMTLSIWCEFGEWLQRRLGRRIAPARAAPRAGDQRVFVSDVRLAETHLGWRPRVDVNEGVEAFFQWISADQRLSATL